MRERVTRCRVVSQSCCCTSARTTFEAIPLQSTQRRKRTKQNTGGCGTKREYRLWKVLVILFHNVVLCTLCTLLNASIAVQIYCVLLRVEHRE